MGMTHRLLASLIALVALCFDVQAQTKPPIEAFGSLPKFSQPSLSPDGKFLASIQEFEGRPVAVIRPVEGGTPRGVALPDTIVTQIRWLKNDRLMFAVRAFREDRRFIVDKQTVFRGLTVNPDAGELAPLLTDNNMFQLNSSTASVADLNLSDPDHILIPLWVTNVPDSYNPLRRDSGLNYFRLSLMKAHVRNGTSSQFVNANSNTIQWYTDGQGKVIARLDQPENQRIEKLFALKDGSWRQVGSWEVNGDSDSGIVGVASDGVSLVRYVVDKNRTLVRLDLETGKDVETLSDPRYDVTGTIKDEWTGRVIGVSYSGAETQVKYFDPQHQALQKGIEAAFPSATSAYAASESLDRSLAIVVVEAPRTPPTFYLLNRKTHMASEIARTYPMLREADLGEMKPYDYTARDGLRIPAFITLPPGRTPKNLPAVVMPHGGPDSHDTLGFDWWAQLMANRGYVVLQPNFRGSTSYGRQFTEAGFSQWGRKMQDDVTDGVKKMIADGIVDPKRVCIVGGSYGGYSALAGAAFTPDIYACAASFAGVFDLTEMLRQERIEGGRKSQRVQYWHQRIGSIYSDADLIRQVSPALHADKVKIPILLMHAEQDTTVPIDQSEMMEKALKQAGKNVKFIRFPGDDHSLALSETRTKMLTELEQFLAEHIGEKKTAAN